MDSYIILTSKSFIAFGNAKHLRKLCQLALKITTTLWGIVKKVKTLISFIDTALFNGERIVCLVCIATQFLTLLQCFKYDISNLVLSSDHTFTKGNPEHGRKKATHRL